MLLYRRQYASQNRDIKIADREFENLAKFKYLRTTVTNQNLIQEEIKRRLNSDNACCHSAELLSSRLLSNYLKIRIYKNIIFSVVMYGCETWFLTLKEEHRLRVFENRVLMRIFGPKRIEVTGREKFCDLYSSPSSQPRSTPQKHYFFASGTHFC
jgi:hypothetical protein